MRVESGCWAASGVMSASTRSADGLGWRSASSSGVLASSSASAASSALASHANWIRRAVPLVCPFDEGGGATDDVSPNGYSGKRWSAEARGDMRDGDGRRTVGATACFGGSTSAVFTSASRDANVASSTARMIAR